MKRRFTVIQGGLSDAEAAAAGRSVARPFAIVGQRAAPFATLPGRDTLEATGAALRERLAALDAQILTASAGAVAGRWSARHEAPAGRGPIPAQAFFGVRPEGWEASGTGPVRQG